MKNSQNMAAVGASSSWRRQQPRVESSKHVSDAVIGFKSIHANTGQPIISKVVRNELMNSLGVVLIRRQCVKEFDGSPLATGNISPDERYGQISGAPRVLHTNNLNPSGAQSILRRRIETESRACGQSADAARHYKRTETLVTIEGACTERSDPLSSFTKTESRTDTFMNECRVARASIPLSTVPSGIGLAKNWQAN